jgi:hypothetical protein
MGWGFPKEEMTHFDIGSHYVAQAGLELKILLPLQGKRNPLTLLVGM